MASTIKGWLCVTWGLLKWLQIIMDSTKIWNLEMWQHFNAEYITFAFHINIGGSGCDKSFRYWITGKYFLQTITERTINHQRVSQQLTFLSAAPSLLLQLPTAGEHAHVPTSAAIEITTVSATLTTKTNSSAKVKVQQHWLQSKIQVSAISMPV